MKMRRNLNEFSAIGFFHLICKSDPINVHDTDDRAKAYFFNKLTLLDVTPLQMWTTEERMKELSYLQQEFDLNEEETAKMKKYIFEIFFDTFNLL